MAGSPAQAAGRRSWESLAHKLHFGQSAGKIRIALVWSQGLRASPCRKSGSGINRPSSERAGEKGGGEGRGERGEGTGQGERKNGKRETETRVRDRATRGMETVRSHREGPGRRKRMEGWLRRVAEGWEQGECGHRWEHEVWGRVTSARLSSGIRSFPAPNKGTQTLALGTGPGVLPRSLWICHKFCCVTSGECLAQSGPWRGRPSPSLVLRSSEVISLVFQRKTGWICSAPRVRKIDSGGKSGCAR